MAYTVGIVSLGCAKNRVDAEMMMYNLRQGGFTLVEDAAMADAAIINTCGFIESAKQESIDEILELATLKREGKIKAIIVTGCLAQRYNSQVMEQLSEVDAVIGIGANSDICEVVTKALNGGKVESFPDKLSLSIDGKRVLSMPPHKAYLKIAEGCDNCCTYCAIPLIRGKYRSRTMESVVDEAKYLASVGVKELDIIAQDTTRYGIDIYGKLMLSTLLSKLCEVDGIQWIRVLYGYPDYITDELLDAMNREDKIVKYLDLPLQHCNGEILRRMNRRGDIKSLEALIHKIREKIPGVVLRTTLIAGFPGETQEQFDEMLGFVNDMKFERLGCFAYSPEEDTKAALMENQIDDELRKKRAEIITTEQQRIMEKIGESRIGENIAVLVDGYDRYAQCCFGSSAADAPEVDPCVFFTCDGKKPFAGEFVTVKVTDCIDGDLCGEMI